MKGVVYHLGARFDVLQIVEFYERSEGPELAERFILHITERPESYKEVRRGIRKASLSRFPHHVLFQVIDGDTIKILAVKHDKRHPDFGLDR